MFQWHGVKQIAYDLLLLLIISRPMKFLFIIPIYNFCAIIFHCFPFQFTKIVFKSFSINVIHNLCMKALYKVRDSKFKKIIILNTKCMHLLTIYF